MDYEQFDYIENKMIEAARNHSPGFDEKAWERMEALLDKGLKRKPFLWIWGLLFCLLLGTFSVILYDNKEYSGNKPGRHTLVTTMKKGSGDHSIGETIADNPFEKASAPGGGGTLPANVNKIQATVKKSWKPGKLIKAITSAAADDLKQENKAKYSLVSKFDLSITPALAVSGDDKTGSNLASPPVNEVTGTGNSARLDSPELKEKTDKSTGEKKSGTDEENPLAKAKDLMISKKPSPISKFFLLASIGADNSSVSPLSFRNSKTRALYGVGIGYQLGHRLTIQTGFFATHKIYTAGPGDYKTRPNPYWQTVQLLSVDANCLVYDIPLVVSYSLVQRRKMGIYASVGASSYIMKKENYRYNLYGNNAYRQYDMAYTGNSHFLAHLTLSAGVQRKLTDRFSLGLEPYFGLPLKGVGDGRVKLYSAGLNLRLKYFPF